MSSESELDIHVPQPKPAAPPQQPPKLSKKKKRKMEQIRRKSEANARRAGLLRELAEHAVDESTLSMLAGTASGLKKKRFAEREFTLRKAAVGVKDEDVKNLYTRTKELMEKSESNRCLAKRQVQSELDRQTKRPKREAIEPMAREPGEEGAYQAKEPNEEGAAKRSAAVPVEKTPHWSRDPSNFYRRSTLLDLPRTVEMERFRMTLPALDSEMEVVETAFANDVFIVIGSTGCGKSTQVPQFLFESGLTCEESHGLMIAVTQPRRVAALSVARRVAAEMNAPHLVGYQVRFDSSQVKKTTRLKFMTDGILLKEIQSDFLLSKYGCIIVDEAHERTLNTDILLGLLSRAVQVRRNRFERGEADLPPLKLCIMSATLRLCDFTENKNLFLSPPPVISIGAKTHPVTVHWNKTTAGDFIAEAKSKVMKIHQKLPAGSILVFMTGQREVHQLVKAIRSSDEVFVDEGTDHDDSDCEDDADEEEFDSLVQRVQMEAQKVEPEPTADEADGTRVAPSDEEEMQVGLLQTADEPSPSGQTVLDLSVEELAEKLGFNRGGALQEKRQHWHGMDRRGKLRVVPLYASMPHQSQLEAFRPPAADERVVVVATNVAETSVTIPNVRYVVDSGREKQRKFRPGSGVSYFETCFVSKANADQRAGRCGRVGPGHCFRLYSSAVYKDIFQPFPPVPLMETPLDGVLLFLSSLNIPNVSLFPFPSPPPYSRMKAARELLETLGALSPPPMDPQKRKAEMVRAQPLGLAAALPKEGVAGRITDVGMVMSQFPVAPRYARMLLQVLATSEADLSGKSSSVPSWCFAEKESVDRHEYIGLGCMLIAFLTLGSVVFDQTQPIPRKADNVEVPAWTEFSSDLDGLLWIAVYFARAPDRTRFAMQNVLSHKQCTEGLALASQLYLLSLRLLPQIGTATDSSLSKSAVLSSLRLHSNGADVEGLRLRAPGLSQRKALHSKSNLGLVNQTASFTASSITWHSDSTPQMDPCLEARTRPQSCAPASMRYSTLSPTWPALHPARVLWPITAWWAPGIAGTCFERFSLCWTSRSWRP